MEIMNNKNNKYFTFIFVDNETGSIKNNLRA
jgi:hypothetical protein